MRVSKVVVAAGLMLAAMSVLIVGGMNHLIAKEVRLGGPASASATSTPERNGVLAPRPDIALPAGRNVRTSEPAALDSSAKRPPVTNAAGSTTASELEPLASIPPPTDKNWSTGKFAHFTPEELRNMAARCELRWQLPPYGSTPQTLSLEDAGRLGLDEQARSVYNRDLEELNQRFVADVRALYSQMSGDPKGGDSSSVRVLMDEIRRSASSEEQVRVAKLLSQERAGMTPDEKLDDSMYARFMQMQLRQGEALEAALTRDLGPSIAEELGGARGPRFTVTGCEPDQSLYRSERLRP